MLVPGFEVVGPGGGWNSAELSRGLETIHARRPEAVVGVHLQPERATGASHPVESNDPWLGGEPEFWRSHGGQYADVLLYQTPHGSKLLTGNDWEDRWIEILDRLGIGALGWRRVGVNFFEVTTFDYYRGGAQDADNVRLANRAKQLCDVRGVPCTFGSGIP